MAIESHCNKSFFIWLINAHLSKLDWSYAVVLYCSFAWCVRYHSTLAKNANLKNARKGAGTPNNIFYWPRRSVTHSMCVISVVRWCCYGKMWSVVLRRLLPQNPCRLTSNFSSSLETNRFVVECKCRCTPAEHLSGQKWVGIRLRQRIPSAVLVSC